MTAASVPGFSPEASGFAFKNEFPPVPAWTITIPAIGHVALGDASKGLCGGMVFAARDFFEFGFAPPPIAVPPSNKAPLFVYIVERLLASFDLPLGPARYFDWMRCTDPEIATRTRAAWPEIQRVLDSHKPAPIGLILVESNRLADLGKNHQVLAFGYEHDTSTGVLSLRVYDPNRPGEVVTLSCNTLSTAAFAPSYPAAALRGFFPTPYAPRDPRFLVGARANPPPPWWAALWSVFARLWTRKT